jgi:hypothetical protein
MENIEKIVDIAESLNYDQVVQLCDILVDPSVTKNNLTSYIDSSTCLDLMRIIKIPYFIKHTEFEDYLVLHPELKFSYIEDWKDENKLNLITLLTALNFINESNLHKIIGNQSKKTYKSGLIINDNSLSLKKFFNPEYRDFRTRFYKNLDLVIKSIVKLGISIDLVEQTVYSMIAIIQADIICREKYNRGEYFDYKMRITDIVDTRHKEDMLYNYFNKVAYYKLVHDPLHPALKCILFNSWTETKQKYTWVTELITFINNNNPDSKDYLLNNVGIGNFCGTDYITKCNVIENVALSLKLNIGMKKQIIKFLFSISTYYKHKTYNKWYSKEMESIELFEKHKEYDLEETLINLTQKLGLNNDIQIENNTINQLMNLMSGYYMEILHKFRN